jgi:hypothetical protein
MYHIFFIDSRNIYTCSLKLIPRLVYLTCGVGRFYCFVCVTLWGWQILLSFPTPAVGRNSWNTNFTGCLFIAFCYFY